MANGGMPSWEEWNEQLTEEQRRYSQYKILSDLYHRDCKREDTCEKRLAHCVEIFKNHQLEIDGLKNRKKFDTTVSGVFGLVGGALAIVGRKIIAVLTGG